VLSLEIKRSAGSGPDPAGFDESAALCRALPARSRRLLTVAIGVWAALPGLLQALALVVPGQTSIAMTRAARAALAGLHHAGVEALLGKTFGLILAFGLVLAFGPILVRARHGFTYCREHRSGLRQAPNGKEDSMFRP
ncbi:MAG TPA: hypothetical protein VE423_10250, partial [Microvirga sp.]|nr:hypothetical protein [Microvirga sp.]